jgi:hypothetical protein
MGGSVKIALVALPEPEETAVEPPLPLAYIAAMLEQQRHIVRIYDLALCDAVSLAEALAPLRTFRPHIVAIAATDPRAAAAANAALSSSGAAVLYLGSALRSFVPGQTIASTIWRLERQTAAEDDQNLIFSTLLALDDELDALPFPARHLLPLEQYPLSTPTGALQTTLLAGQIVGGKLVPRNPALVIAELQSIAREHGVHHVQFLDPPLTYDLVWLRELLYDLADADLGMGWEGAVRHQSLSPELLDLFRRAGCEALCFEFNAVDVLDSREERAALSGLVAQAHELGMWVRAQIELAPPYGAISALVDMSATFGLDDVRFNVKQRAATSEAERPEPTDVAEMAHERYRSRRSRQLFIQRFGPQLGPMLWRAGRAGLLGRAWQYYADGVAERAPA